jgi:hypothetical protein
MLKAWYTRGGAGLVCLSDVLSHCLAVSHLQRGDDSNACGTSADDCKVCRGETPRCFEGKCELLGKGMFPNRPYSRWHLVMAASSVMDAKQAVLPGTPQPHNRAPQRG